MMKILVLFSLSLLGVGYASVQSASNTKQLTIQYNVTDFKARNSNQIAYGLRMTPVKLFVRFMLLDGLPKEVLKKILFH